MDTNYPRWQLRMQTPSWHPPTDIFETSDSIVIRVEIAGMHEDDFSIEINGPQLTIKGARLDISEQRAYQQMEIRFGEFIIEYEFTVPVESQNIEAIYKSGFLRVDIPKSKPRQIDIGQLDKD